ncbi:MAG: penicillin-binding transpeptidase domain-containing protein, partial [Bacillota bacterium]|nr:penicillin-binding transpeptidase domain-containing protein [Bacillota bacterium]
SYAAYSIVTANLGRNMDDVYQHLVNLLADFDVEISVEQINDAIKAQGLRRYESVPILRDVPFELVTLIKERQEELPGIDIEIEPRRVYPNSGLAGHILGYVMQINSNQLENYRQYDYRMGDPFGQAGLERVFEFVENGEQEIGLRGQKGVRQVEVNVANRPIRELLTIPSVPGNNVKLTIDFDLQRVMEDALASVIAQRAEVDNPKAAAGAAVAIDPRTGAILAMASYPSMDPNDYDFINGLPAERQEYYSTPISPGLNRAMQGSYAPGSTFKMITGMAALEAGVLPTQTVNCTGGYPGGIRCLQAHGPSDYYRALAVSCNTYFQAVALRAGADKMAEVAREFGLGEKTGIILQGEQAGIVPSPTWKLELNSTIIDRRYATRYENLDQEYEELIANAESEKEKEQLLKDKDRRRKALEAQYRIDYNFHTRWQDFDTFNTSIGQGSNNYTILQLANLAATIGNGGYLYEPYLVDSIIDQSGKEVKKFEPELVREVNVSKETIEHTKKAMLAVAQPGGSAYRRFAHFPEEIQVAGKTGTSQSGRPGTDLKEDFDGLFVGFAPYDNPEIAIAVIVEYGGSGSLSAAVVSQMVLEEYFGVNRTN